MKTKRKSYCNEAAEFHDKEIHILGSSYTCLAVMLIDFVLSKDENYYEQVFEKNLNKLKKKKKWLDILLMT